MKNKRVECIDKDGVTWTINKLVKLGGRGSTWWRRKINDVIQGKRELSSVIGESQRKPIFFRPTRVEIIIEGETWTAHKLMLKTGANQRWASRWMRKIIDGRAALPDAFHKAKCLQNGKWRFKKHTIKTVMKATGVEYHAARVRIQEALRNPDSPLVEIRLLRPKDLKMARLAARRRRQPSRQERRRRYIEEMGPRRLANYKALKKATNDNEFLRS